MIEKLKCPFCGTELRENITSLSCPNEYCKYSNLPLPSKIWAYIIAGKKELDREHAVWQTLSEIRTPSPEDYIKNIGQKRGSFITPNMYLLCVKETKIIKDLRDTIKKDK